MSEATQSPADLVSNKLGEAVSFPNSAEYRALSAQQKADYTRNDATAHGYAWGRLDQGHPPVASVIVAEPASTTGTAWAFGSLYAKMLLELHDPAHPRLAGFSMPSAWEVFVKTGCPEGRLPLRLS